MQDQPTHSLECEFCGRLFDPLPSHDADLDIADCDECPDE